MYRNAVSVTANVRKAIRFDKMGDASFLLTVQVEIVYHTICGNARTKRKLPRGRVFVCGRGTCRKTQISNLLKERG